MEWGMESGGTSPSEGGAEVTGVLKAHGELREKGASMHVRFACNVILAPLYPNACLSTAQICTTPFTLPVGRTTLTLQERPGHLLTERRLKGGLPSESVTPASGSALGRVPLHTSLRKRGRSMHSDVPTCGTVGAADTSPQFGRENRRQSDPPAHDPFEDMDCGEDRRDACLIPSAEADASMHSITDNIAHIYSNKSSFDSRMSNEIYDYSNIWCSVLLFNSN